MKNFLIFGHNYAGDALMLTPAIRAVKERFPGAVITVTAGPGAADVLSRNPDVARVVGAGKTGGLKGLAASVGLFRELRKIASENGGRFDACFNFLRSLKFALMGYALSQRQAGIAESAGFSAAGLLKGFLFDETVYIGNIRHNADKALALAAAFNRTAAGGGTGGGANFNPRDGRDAAPETALAAPPPSRKYVYALRPEDLRAAAEMLSAAFGISGGNGGFSFPYAVFSPGSTRRTKEANPETLAAFADYLNAAGIRVVITGTPKDAAVSSRVFGKIKDKAMSADLSGRTDIFTLGGLLKAARLAVCVDNGAMHLAAALDAPLVAVFGSTDPSVCGPVSDPGRSCVIDVNAECRHCFGSVCARESFGSNGYPDCTGAASAADFIGCAAKLGAI